MNTTTKRELFELGFAPIGVTLKGVNLKGDVIEIDLEEAYYKYRLTVEDLFTKADCDKVLNSMEHYGIIAFEDACCLIDSNTSNIITREKILGIRESLEF